MKFKVYDVDKSLSMLQAYGELDKFLSINKNFNVAKTAKKLKRRKRRKIYYNAVETMVEND